MMASRRELLSLAVALSGLASARVSGAVDAKSGAVSGRLLRGFVNIPEGQIHYRYREPERSQREPLLMLHGFPSSAWILEPYVAALGADRRVYAFDLMGMGDSTGLPQPAPTIADLAVAVTHGLDALEVGRCDVYGTLTGARVATELALLEPGRVRRLILDEPGVQPPEEIAEFLERYMPSLDIDQEGSQFQRIFNFCRDAYVWFPWYRRTVETQRNWVDLPSARVLHLKTMEILKSMDHITGVFEASEKYPVADKLPQLAVPTLVTEDGHGLIPGAELLELPRIEAVSATAQEVSQHVARFRHFLDA